MRIMDFSLAMYAEVCKALQSHSVVTVQEYLSNKPKPPYVVLRHDVDRSLKYALAMAKLEHEYGIESTYYFRYPNTFNSKVIEQIYDLGHEIGYHYEVLDKARGDSRKAIAIFQKELEVFRKFFPVKTICMHGNPLTRWDGRNLWSLYDFRDYGLLGEAFLSCSDIPIYLTDTGRNWNGDLNFKDKLKAEKENRNLKSTVDVIQFLNSKKVSCIYLNCHPERWGPGTLGWLKALLRDHLFNFGKKVLKLVRCSFLKSSRL
ncbi:MAG: hypothetical protein EWM47_07495 [Anaerolineaceae bacterium]|nr:MAG: hypothetical protein EWM47_07495 [Anaerolineaceae bacterium]